MVCKIFHRCDSFGSIDIKHQNSFDPTIISLYFLQLPSHNVVMTVHVEVELQIFDEIQSHCHDLLLFYDLSPRLLSLDLDFGLLFRQQGLQEVLFCAQGLQLTINS